MIPASLVVSKRLGQFIGIAALALLGLAGCADHFRPPAATAAHPITTSGYFSLPGGATLPYRSWLPDGQPRAVVLALHGFNDSRDAWEVPASAFTRAGIALYSPDQRGFGLAPRRGLWPPGGRLVADAREMATILRRRYPETKLIVMGESMGGAVTLMLGAAGDPEVNGYVAVSPAVWGGPAMSPGLHLTIDTMAFFAPSLRLTGQAAHVTASDNLQALIALFEDPLTIRATTMASAAGLVRFMGQALAACRRFAPPHALILYGGHDQLIPEEAMADCWRTIPVRALEGGAVTLGYYPHNYHLMLRDRERAAPIRDIIAFILHPDQPLASPAPMAATIFMAQQ